MLAAFAEGSLEVEVHGAVELHLADCEECRDILAAVAAVTRSGVSALASTLAADDADASSGEDLSPGTHVGRYVIDATIGRGAMGVVYAAHDPDLDRKVALKLLHTGAHSAAHDMRTRLLREAQAMARLSHPNVITVHDVGSFGGQLFVAMEYVAGGTLRSWLAGGRSVDEILAVFRRAGSGLAAAHAAGLVHRDFKPDNVLVGEDGRVRVTDFGLARADDADGSPPDDAVADTRPLTMTLTRTGTLLGTPAYMAPEQLRGAVADARSDLFSFSVALYEALYERRPFAGKTVAELRKAIDAGRILAPPPGTQVPAWVRAALVRGLRAAPAERFASMRDMLDALEPPREKRRIGYAMLLVAAGATGLALLYARSDAPRVARNDAVPLAVVSSAPTPANEVASAPTLAAPVVDAAASAPVAVRPAPVALPPKPSASSSAKPAPVRLDSFERQ